MIAWAPFVAAAVGFGVALLSAPRMLKRIAVPSQSVSVVAGLWYLLIPSVLFVLVAIPVMIVKPNGECATDGRARANDILRKQLEAVTAERDRFFRDLKSARQPVAQCAEERHANASYEALSVLLGERIRRFALSVQSVCNESVDYKLTQGDKGLRLTLLGHVLDTPVYREQLARLEQDLGSIKFENAIVASPAASCATRTLHYIVLLDEDGKSPRLVDFPHASAEWAKLPLGSECARAAAEIESFRHRLTPSPEGFWSLSDNHELVACVQDSGQGTWKTKSYNLQELALMLVQRIPEAVQ